MGTLGFTGQLIPLLLVIQWLEQWCASLAAPFRSLQSRLNQLLQAAANHHHSIVKYIMYQPAEMQGPWSGIAIVKFEPATCRSVF